MCKKKHVDCSSDRGQCCHCGYDTFFHFSLANFLRYSNFLCQKNAIMVTLHPGVDFINPFMLYALCSAPNFYARPKKLLKSWAQSIRWLCAQLLAFMKSTAGLKYVDLIFMVHVDC